MNKRLVWLFVISNCKGTDRPGESIQLSTHSNSQSLSHLDDSMRKTEKSFLMRGLEKKVHSVPHDKVTNVTTDGMFLLHTLLADLPSTLRGVTQYILRKIMQMAENRVDLDTYKSSSFACHLSKT